MRERLWLVTNQFYKILKTGLLLVIPMMAVMGVGLTALERKDMTLCGEKNVFGDYCRMPIYYSKDESLRDVACGMCGSEIDCQGFIMNVNYCHECKEERNSILQFCMRHSPADQLQKKEKLQ